MKVRFTQRARAHLEAALDYIAADSPAAAAAVSGRVEHSLGLIGDFPMMGRRGVEPGTREFAVPRTPYIVVNVVTDHVEVVAVLHGRQDRQP